MSIIGKIFGRRWPQRKIINGKAYYHFDEWRQRMNGSWPWAYQRDFANTTKASKAVKHITGLGMGLKAKIVKGTPGTHIKDRYAVYISRNVFNNPTVHKG